MAEFCAVFSWCSPEAFWRLSMNEYTALHAVMKEGGRGA